MYPLPGKSATPAMQRSTLFVVCLWLLGAFACRYLGVWAGVGGAAIIGGGLVLTLHGKAVSPLFRWERRHVLTGIAAGALMTAATYLLYPVLGSAVPGLTGTTGELYGLFNTGWAPLRLALLPLIVLGEELVWRGLVQGVAEQRLGRVAGVALTAFVYGAAHLPAAAPLLAGVAICCGLYWGALRALTGSLVPALIAHLIWDAAVMVAFPLQSGR